MKAHPVDCEALGEGEVPLLEVIDFETLTVTMEGGIVLPIVSMFDDEGEDTDEPEEAYALCAGTDEWGWIEVNIGELQELTYH